MRISFKDELFDAQLLRTISNTYYGGAEIGECLATAERITEVNPESWYQEWWRSAEGLDQAGENTLASGHRTSAREAFLRASTYYRTAQARQLFEALTCPREFLTFTSAEGAGEHCEVGNRALFHQRVFDWLGTTLPAPARSAAARSLVAV